MAKENNGWTGSHPKNGGGKIRYRAGKEKVESRARESIAKWGTGRV